MHFFTFWLQWQQKWKHHQGEKDFLQRRTRRRRYKGLVLQSKRSRFPMDYLLPGWWLLFKPCSSFWLEFTRKRRPTHKNIAVYWFPIWQVYRLQPSPRLVSKFTWQVRSLSSSRGRREVVGWEHTIAKLLKHQIGSEKGQWRMCHTKNRQRERLSARNTHSYLSALRERHTVIAQGSECSHAHKPACWNPTPNAMVLRCGMDKEMELVSFS